ncbi:MAG: AAA family ATPase [Snowella sp.]|nr:AAA family ATPase [Snowella sp.]
MELIIKNLGPIKGNQQSIDLSKKFFIFLGYNNSGKTYVSQLLWTIFNQDKHIQFIKSSFSNGILENVSEQNQGQWQIELTQTLIDSILEKFSFFLQEEIFTVLNQDKSNNIERENPLFSLKANINDFVNGEITDVIIKPINTSLIRNDIIPLSEGRLAIYLKITKECGKRTLKFSLHGVKKLTEKIWRLYSIRVLLAFFIHTPLIQSKFPPFFLPASRAFFSTFYTYIYEVERNKREEDFRLISELKSLKSIEEITKKIFRRSYTQPVSQVIEALYDLNHNSSSLDIYNAHLIELAEIMGGDIILDRVEGIGPVQFSFRFKENKKEIDLPMYLASSSANQLTLLYLYFKYWAREKGNFLIIDEPEVNLHPENQIKLLDLLINFVNQSNNKVLIATHSPLLADAVNNYLYIDNLRQYYNDEQIKQVIDDHRLKYLYPDTKLSREDLGVYFFNDKGKIIDYNNEDDWVDFTNFRNVKENLYESGKILTNYIYQKENE